MGLFVFSCSKPDSEDPVISLFTINGSEEDTVEVTIQDALVLDLMFQDNKRLSEMRLAFRFAGVDSFMVETYPALSVLSDWEYTNITSLMGEEEGVEVNLTMSDLSLGDWSVVLECLDEEGNQAVKAERLISVSNELLPVFAIEGTEPEVSGSGTLDVTQLSLIQIDGSLFDAQGIDSLITIFYDPSGDSIVSRSELMLLGQTDYSLQDLTIEVPLTEATSLYLTLIAYDLDAYLNAYGFDVFVVD